MDTIIRTDCESILDYVDLSPLRNKTVLITGVSGMLGTYILSCIRQFNEKYNAGIKVNAVAYRNLPEHLSDMKECSFINIIPGDLTDAGFCDSLPKADVIFHAAGYAQPARFMENNANTIKLNTLTTALMLEKLNADGRFLFFSSVAVYIGYDGNADENAPVFNIKRDNDPRECYYRGKKTGEYLCSAYSILPSKNIKIVRIGLTYGPGTRPDDKKALSDFIAKARTGKIELRDSGIDLQHYTYITDMVKMLLKSFLYGKEQVYNIGNPDRVSIAQVAQAVGKIMNANVVIPSGCGPGQQVTANIDVSRYLSEFPNTTFDSLPEGIKRTVEWKNLWNTKKQ